MNASELWNRHVSLPLESFDLHPITLSNIESLVVEYFPKDYNDVEKQMALSANKGTIIKYIIDHLDDLNYKDAEKLLFSVDSFNRPEILYLMASLVDSKDWLRLFRDFWTQCDSCSLYHNEYKEVLLAHKIETIREVTHSEDDIKFYNALPETFEVYRGTFVDERFAGGISWTTDRDVAEKFEAGYQSFANNGPMVYRYRINMTDEKFDLLKDIAKSGTAVLTRTVNKSEVFVNTSRGEHEIFVIGDIA